MFEHNGLKTTIFLIVFNSNDMLNLMLWGRRVIIYETDLLTQWFK